MFLQSSHGECRFDNHLKNCTELPDVTVVHQIYNLVNKFGSKELVRINVKLVKLSQALHDEILDSWNGCKLKSDLKNKKPTEKIIICF